jgi:hypothetical protein
MISDIEGVAPRLVALNDGSGTGFSSNQALWISYTKRNASQTSRRREAHREIAPWYYSGCTLAGICLPVSGIALPPAAPIKTVGSS